MYKRKTGLLRGLFVMAILTGVSAVAGSGDGAIKNIDETGINNKPSAKLFLKAMMGYERIQADQHLSQKKHLLTVVDFSLPSTAKRLWVIDLETNNTLYHTYVAHGKNTGGLYANNFSNVRNSNQSSLGFYLTGEIYYGKNGLSLRLDGLEPGINDLARERAIVIHGAWYASEKLIEDTGRLGRSYGCPAVPEEVHKEMINDIADKTVFFIYKDDTDYTQKSVFFN